MSHIREHCKKPRYLFRRRGSLWACNCGQMWIVSYGQYGKYWKEFNIELDVAYWTGYNAAKAEKEQDEDFSNR